MFDAALKLIQDAVKETLAFIMADNGNYVLKEKKKKIVKFIMIII